ncbi:hypothetical protein EJV46_04740 [Roseococcus sp. SYP-B2431]|uniref:Rap1a/Tai family immunity protein n=1 Tax=Roseococcus sp. SYP-B2431 TaxID=2496640 RepID=UPI0010409B29|nr:Rap1a/Tai family immunity protein [Roseococcus sp. SYP-B2431]TCH99971.1 hypothetical protein EJV46_04740 [Roseococcus sp. SYP-B2431]
MRFVTTLAGSLVLLAAAMGGAPAQTTAPAPAGPTASGPVTAGPVTTGNLASLCGAPLSEEVGHVSQAFCRGVIVGVGQYHMEISRPGGRAAIFCLPTPTPTLEAAQTSFVAWAAANPQHAGELAVNGLLRWAAATYPCPTARGARR